MQEQQTPETAPASAPVQIHEAEKKSCAVCPYALGFAFVMLLLVMTVVYFQGKHNDIPTPIADDFYALPFTVEQAASATPAFDQRLGELENALQAPVVRALPSTSSAQSVTVKGYVPFDKSLLEIKNNSESSTR
jgi:hypothetical protein